jgi:hypothetical protein
MIADSVPRFSDLDRCVSTSNTYMLVIEPGLARFVDKLFLDCPCER